MKVKLWRPVHLRTCGCPRLLLLLAFSQIPRLTRVRLARRIPGYYTLRTHPTRHRYAATPSYQQPAVSDRPRPP
uniref:Putative secreted protein n=1 Tax=Anopheles darlingi TaxID=43151 RepID=A0A2M4DDD0_ANODA